MRSKTNYPFTIPVPPVSEAIATIRWHSLLSLDGTGTRTATIRASPHWLMSAGGGSSSRSGSNPSSELSCLTQNTNLIFGSNDTHATAIPVTHYGFPSTVTSSSSSAAAKSHSLINGNHTIRSSAFDQQQQQQQQTQSSSNNSTPNRMKKLFYEVVVWWQNIFSRDRWFLSSSLLFVLLWHWPSSLPFLLPLSQATLLVCVCLRVLISSYVLI